MFKTQLIGNIGKDAEVKDVNSYKLIAFSVAHSERWKDKNGENQQKTTWIECQIWRQPGKEGVASLLKKGAKVYIEGTSHAEAYQNKAGEIVATNNIKVNQLEILSYGKESSKENSTSPTSNGSSNGNEDLPF